MTKILLFFLIIFFILSSTNVINAEVTIDTNTSYTVGNINYTVNDTTRIFNQIIIDDNYIVFNNTGFNVTSVNPITIYIDYIDDDIIHANNNDLILEFVANTNAGTVTFNINGMKNLQQYTVRRDGTSIATPTSNISGSLTFTNNAWSNHTFTIFQGATTTPTPGTTTTINILTYFPILIILALLSALAIMMFTGMTDIKALILWTIMFVIAMLTIIIITT